jgi:hypothetical protein
MIPVWKDFTAKYKMIEGEIVLGKPITEERWSRDKKR